MRFKRILRNLGLGVKTFDGITPFLPALTQPHNLALDVAANTRVAANPWVASVSHPWPEWIQLMKCLLSKGILCHEEEKMFRNAGDFLDKGGYFNK
ncbi:hypothetical protein D0Y65_026932 [Glycine soja]|uniref:Uncharacterized protein n=1 Tax=Glycine soja TaxID=3848 RepID=A0A445ILR7_GLYSO|nr:hypothetical protein D0Y65_026932 [Glycine soja]